MGIAGLSYNTITTSRAKSTELSLGHKPFIEVDIKYNIPENRSTGNADGLPKYLIDDQNGIIGFMQHRSFEGFADAEFILTDGQSFYLDVPSRIYGESTLTIDTSFDFNKGTGKFITISEEIQQPEVKITSIKKNTVQGMVNDNYFSVRPNEEKLIKLSDREVKVPKEYVADSKPEELVKEEIKVTPQINIRNKGLMHLFGAQHKYVIPANSENNMTQIIYETRMSEPESVHRDVKNTGPNQDRELLVVQTEVTNNE